MTTSTATNAPHPAMDVLDSWLNGGHVASRVEDWADRVRTSTHSADRYTEAQMAKQVAQREPVASAIKQTAQGMRALAEVNPTDGHNGPVVYLATDLPVGSFAGFDRGSQDYRDTQTVLVFNPEVPGCGCMQPEGSYLFGHDGILGLRAVALSVDTTRPGLVKLSLILPHRRKEADRSAFTAAQFNLQGDLSTFRYEPTLYTHGPLMHELGLWSQDQVWFPLTGNFGDSNYHLGPGCPELLCSKLGELGDYLTDAADKLSGTHTHSH
jgi:hypothetical protein